MTTGAATTIVYPDSDGMPLPDGETQAPLYIRVVGTLRTFLRNVPGARVNGDTFLYFVQGDAHRFVSPDCYVALDMSDEAMASIERNNAYLLWEVGKAPDFILEIGSKSAAGEDLGRKRDLYADIGVSEYWRYDATGGDFYDEPLVGERLINGEYRRLELQRGSDGAVWSRSEVLDLWWKDGELRFWDPAAERWLLSQEEEQDGRLAAEARMEVERGGRLAAEALAEVERDGRLAAEARVAQLEAELRRLREDA